MGALKLTAVLVAALVAAPAAASQVERWDNHIAEAAKRFEIPPEWIRRVMLAESGGRTTFRGKPIRSSAGALGLMQLMPGTWREMRALHDLGSDPHEPRDNILAGTAYLRLMHDRFGYPGLFAAYNAGPERFARHLATGRPLPAETVAYVAGVSGASGSASPETKPVVSDPLSFGSSPLFVVLRATDPPAVAAEDAAELAITSPAFPSLFLRLGGGRKTRD